jgi:hypothetical protein
MYTALCYLKYISESILTWNYNGASKVAGSDQSIVDEADSQSTYQYQISGMKLGSMSVEDNADIYWLHTQLVWNNNLWPYWYMSVRPYLHDLND